jgi:hypothetical protein
MRRPSVLAWVLTATVALAVVPMGSVRAAPKSESFAVASMHCEIIDEGNWGGAGPTFHNRGGVLKNINYTLVDGEWVESGTMGISEVVLNGGPMTYAAGSPFELRDRLVGDFDGRLEWAMSVRGHGVGKGVGPSAGLSIRFDLWDAFPAGLPALPADLCHGLPDLGFTPVLMVVTVY